MPHSDLRARWKVASDLRFRTAISEPASGLFFLPHFWRLAPSTRKSLAIAIVRFWCAKPISFVVRRSCLGFESLECPTKTRLQCIHRSTDAATSLPTYKDTTWSLAKNKLKITRNPHPPILFFSNLLVFSFSDYPFFWCVFPFFSKAFRGSTEESLAFLVSFFQESQDKFDHDKGQKSAISGRRLHSRLSTGFLLFLQYLCAI